MNVLNFWQAQDKAQAKLKEFNERVDAPLAPYTVRKAIADYIEHLAGRPTREKTRLRLAAYVKPELADMALERVTAPDLTAWLKGMIKMPPRARTAEDAKQRNNRKSICMTRT